MRLLLFRQRNFRNLALAAYRPPPGLSAVAGGNAQGKTNLLKGIHLLLTGEMEGSLQDQIRFGEGEAGEAWLWGEVETALGVFRLEATLTLEGRTFRINGKPTGLKGLLELPGSVLLSPEDVEVVLGSREARRGFLDRLIARFSARYGGLLSAYEKVLRQRNALLRQGGNGLSAWNQALARHGEEIMAYRRRFLARFLPILEEVHVALGGKEVGAQLEETAGPGILEALKATEREERERGQTLVGPHRDDLLFLLLGRPAHRFASRGEAKTLALALRLAEHRLLWQHHEEPPLLLLDEWSEELDEARREALLAYARGLPQAILAGLTAPKGVPVCWMEGGVVLCPGG